MSNNFEIIENEFIGGKCAIIKTALTSDLIEELSKQNIEIVRLSVSLGWKVESIDTLLSEMQLKGLEIYTWGEKLDISLVSNQTRLELLSIDFVPSKKVNLESFVYLKQLFVSDCTKVTGFNSLSKLESVNIDKYPYEDLDFLSGLKNLKKLALTSKKLTSLSSISNLKNLEKVDLFKCSYLQEVNGLAALLNLTILEINNCKSISKIETLPISLSRLIIEDCGELENCRFIEDLEMLEDFCFIGNSLFANGDLSPIVNLGQLKKIAIADKKHYSHTSIQIRNIINKRNKGGVIATLKKLF